MPVPARAHAFWLAPPPGACWGRALQARHLRRRRTRRSTPREPARGATPCDLPLRRGRCDDVVEADGPGRPAQLYEAEVPDCLWHRAPFLGLRADLERPLAPARKRRVVVDRPT